VRYPIVFFLTVLAACNNRTDIPGNIIPPDSMQKIMMDVIVADQYSTLYINKDSLKRDRVKANQDLLESVFKIHHVSKENFQVSLRFYESRPDLNKKIFDSLAAYANIHRSELFKPKPLAKPTVAHPK
jgi:Domain of unknown function (DUF4296)